MVSVESPLTAAARSSDSSDFAVPGSPTSIRPRLVARVIRARSISDGSPTNFRVTPSFGSPVTNRRAACTLRAQPGGLAAVSAARRRSSSPAKRTSAGGRCTDSAGSVTSRTVISASPVALIRRSPSGYEGSRADLGQVADDLGRGDRVEPAERDAGAAGPPAGAVPVVQEDVGEFLLGELGDHADHDAGFERD